MSAPKVTDIQAVDVRQRKTLHINGGSRFSELHYALVVIVAGVQYELGVTRHVFTNGSPGYRVVEDYFVVAGERHETFGAALSHRKAIEPLELPEYRA